jgi:outer membrane immunogenic protein
MRKFLWLLAAAAVLPIPAGAADMPTKAYNAVTAPACAWCGGYAGLEVAYGWNEVKADLITGTKFDPNKFVFGGAAGYRWGNTFIFGLEVSGKYAGAGQTIEKGVDGKLQYYGDASAQFGLAPNSGILVYALAGPSWANFQLSAGDMKATANYFGWHFGGGVDIKAFTENFIIGAQYKHHEWGDGTLLGVLNTSAKNDEIVLRALYRFPAGH